MRDAALALGGAPVGGGAGEAAGPPVEGVRLLSDMLDMAGVTPSAALGPPDGGGIGDATCGTRPLEVEDCAFGGR